MDVLIIYIVCHSQCFVSESKRERFLTTKTTPYDFIATWQKVEAGTEGQNCNLDMCHRLSVCVLLCVVIRRDIACSLILVGQKMDCKFT